MSDPLDPATMDALNALGDEIEAANGTPSNPVQDGAGAETGGEAVHEAAEGEEAAGEAQERTETTAENEGEPEGDETGDEQPAAKKPPPKRSGVEKDVQRLLRERYEARNKQAEAEARAAELERRIAEIEATRRQPEPTAADGSQPAPVVQRPNESGADFNARVQAEARRMTEAAAFNEACNRVAIKGTETHKDFGEAQGALMGAFGRQINARPEFLKAIIKLDNGHDVFHYLGTNLEAAEKLFSNADPVDLIVDMKELSAKLKAPKAQRVSSAPPPVTPVRGGGTNRGGVRLDDDKADIGDWSKQFLKDMAS